MRDMANWQALILAAVVSATLAPGCRQPLSETHQKRSAAVRPEGTSGRTGVAAQDGAADRDAMAVVAAVNDARREHGEPGLVLDGRLTAAARRHAGDLTRTGSFSHRGSDGSSVGDRVERAGYSWSRVAENLASVQPGERAGSVVGRWMASRPHRNNILNRAYKQVGVAHQGGIWVLVLAARD